MSERMKEISELIKTEFFSRREKESNSKIGVGYPVYDEREILELLDSLLDLRISQGKKTQLFEEQFASYIGSKVGVAVNSGSSANLLALSSLLEAGKLKIGDEVIVPAATFATVSSPIYQLGLKPVYVDVSDRNWCIAPEEIEKALSDKTKLIMPVHNLGFPAEMDKIMDIAKRKGLLVLEDCCEAHGAEIDGKKVGSWGDLGTLSFFIAHNITTGEGGMIFTSDSEIEEILRSLREFGRLRNYSERFYSDENLKDYDARYIFSRLGYNLRMTDLTAALGIVQLEKLDDLNKVRIENTKVLLNELSQYQDYLDFPKISGKEVSTYYGFPIIIKDNSPISRKEVCEKLEKSNIETRAMMGGCLPDQPGFKNLPHRISGDLSISKKIRDNAFFIGCHGGISQENFDHIFQVFSQIFSK